MRLGTGIVLAAFATSGAWLTVVGKTTDGVVYFSIAFVGLVWSALQ